ncbi:fatty acid synthase-like isoform X3 [Agrilus planipennis]|uniref:Fatty acid synthase-like isoform X3 n=1 Tax=Agrilus planipennis TaxID=224129 RepID=A0A7F5RM61_AGRPL|nr:fatty acid synthase-like isoform X3 [Agrilus planipennis]
MKNGEEVVISGIGGYFPKSINVEHFQKLLLENADFLDSRWKEGERGVTNVIGRVPGIQFFDTAYFGIHRQQCIHMDPMQRIMLERTFEALVDAGVNPVEIRGKKVGVFVGSSVGENDNIFYESVVSGFGVTGHSRSMMPNRISYWLNLKGPSCDYDSNWLNGLEVIRMAYESIREGHCDSAIIGTANLVVNSEISWTYNDAKLLSPDGITRSFDADANGYGRSDGIVVLYLQRATKAKRIYGTITNAKTCFNGNREGPLVAIDQPSMVKFMKDFYAETGVDPTEVHYVEAYGCGIKHVDETELNAIEEVYCKKRSGPLLIGSIKSNIGHAEASASLVAVVKVLISMNFGTIPANKHYKNPNPKIKGLLNGTLKVVDQNTPWSGDYAAVNAIGLASSYGHLLIKANKKTKKEGPADDLTRLFIASTRTEDGIQKILSTVQQHKNDAEYANLIQEIFATPIPGHLYRGYVLAGNEVKQEFEHYPGKKRPVWFVYSGMGSQWPTMASDLMRIPVFAESIMRSHAILQKKNVDLLNIITTNDPKIFDNILHSFIGIAAVQIALTDVLRTVGVVPDGIIGHSVGELGCAYADGCLTAEQMILAAYARGRASLEAELIPGMMAAVGIGYQEIKSQCPPTVEVACHNGPESCTISGPTKDMEDFVAQLKERGVFARLVNVANIAYHSRYIKPAAPFLLKYLKEIIPIASPRSSKWISTSIPEDRWDSDLAKTSSAEYHTNNLLSSVLFEEGSKHFPKDAIVIEIAPHGLLQAILKRSLPPECTNIALTQRGHRSNVEFLLSGLGRMFISGIDNMRVSALYPKIEYPIGRGTPSLTSIVHWEHSEEWRTGNEDKLNYLVSVKDIQVSLNTEEFKDYAGHKLDSRVILPPSLYLMIVYKMLIDEFHKCEDFVFQNLHFKKVLSIPTIGHVPLSAMVQKGSGEFEVISEDEIIVSGVIKTPETGSNVLLELPSLEIGEEAYQLSSKDFYQEYYHRGCQYSGVYKSIKSLTITNEGSVADVKWCDNWAIFFDLMLQQFFFHAGERKQDIMVPSHIQRLAVSIPQMPSSEDTKVNFNASTGLIYSDGIQISGVRSTPLPRAPKAVLYNCIEFVPFFNKKYQSWENVINFIIQTITLVPGYEDIRSLSVVEVTTEDENIVDKIKSTMTKYRDINATYSIVENPKSIVASQSDPLFVVSDKEFDSDIADYLADSHAFVLTHSNDQIASYPHIVEVSRFEFNNRNYSLIRKAVNTTAVMVNVHGDTLTSKDLARNNLQWVMQFRNTLENLQPKQRLYLVSNVSPYEGINNFVRDVQKQFQNSELLRFIFLLDKEKVTFDDSKPMFKSILKHDLVLTVISDGKIGSYLSIPTELREDAAQVLYSTGNVISNNRIRYIGLNLKDESLNPDKKPELGVIDFSGVNNANQPIMGLACIDKSSYQVIPDSVLSFNVPNDWNLEDAAAVPSSYVMAYYCLMKKARVSPGDNVLIHSACTGIGFACVSVALSIGCKVFVTVATDEQKTYVLQKFKRLTHGNVYSSVTAEFEPLFLLATQGKGAQVVINNLSGRLFEASLRCFGTYGRFIQLGQYDMEQNGTLGLGIFMKSVSFYSVSPESIFQCSIEEKRSIANLVQKGIDNFVVRRLVKTVYDKFDAEKLLSDLNDKGNITRKIIQLTHNIPLGELNTDKKTKFFCDSRSSYLIIGGNAESWIDMAEWLVLRGAKKIIAASESRPQQSSLTRRLTLLQSFYNADIIHAPFKAHTRDSAMELISEVFMLGPIHAVFLLPTNSDQLRNSDIKSVQYIDAALKTKAPKTLFVNLMKEVTGVCQNRSEAGFPTCTVEWQQGIQFSDILDDLDDILSYRSNYIYVKNNEINELFEESNQMLYKKLNNMLPATIEDLRLQAFQASVKPTFIQLSSKSPLKTPELPPVFIVPGLLPKRYVENLAGNLLNPVYCADFSINSIKIKDVSLRLADKMENILPNGPFNIVAVSWGGAIATEIAITLEKRGHTTQLYYLDGAPETIQSTLRLLGSGVKKDIALLTRYLKINAEIYNKLERLSDWDSRLQLVLDSLQYTEEGKTFLKRVLTVLKNRIDELLDYNFNHDKMITGRIFLLRPTGSSKYDNCGLSKICDQAISILIVKGNHTSILQSQETADIINERVKC